MDDSSDARFLELTGQALFGDRWKSALAKELGLSQPLISMIMSGERRLSKEHCERLAALCGKWTIKFFEKARAMSEYRSEWADRAAE